jgi:predicted CXXCH cytochrome family protein
LTGSEVPFIECSSCHDPHTTNPLFLRVSNEGSRLCLTCHDK